MISEKEKCPLNPAALPNTPHDNLSIIYLTILNNTEFYADQYQPLWDFTYLPRWNQVSSLNWYSSGFNSPSYTPWRYLITKCSFPSGSALYNLWSKIDLHCCKLSSFVSNVFYRKHQRFSSKCLQCDTNYGLFAWLLSKGSRSFVKCLSVLNLHVWKISSEFTATYYATILFNQSA